MAGVVAVDRAVDQLSKQMRVKRILTTSSSGSVLVSLTKRAVDFVLGAEARILKSAASLATSLQAGALETLRVCRTGVGLVPPVSTATAVAVGSGVIIVGGSIIRRLYASVPSSFVLHLKQAKREKAAGGKGGRAGEKRGLPPGCDGRKKRTSGQTKEIMFFCYQEDVRVNKWRNAKIAAPPAANGLRVMTFNIHFFKSGYSNIEMGGNMEKVLSLVEEYEPDVLCLQEVVVEVAGDFMRGLHALGYLEDDIVTAGCADVHVLPSDQPSYASSRLNVAMFSRRHRRGADSRGGAEAGGEGVGAGPTISVVHADRVALAPADSALADPSPGGYAAFQSLEMEWAAAGTGGASSPTDSPPASPGSPVSPSSPTGAGRRRTVASYTMHLSVRCPPSTRLNEMAALLADLARREKDRGAEFDLVLISGDFNQPNKSDYPASEWALIAEDLKACNLPEDDGVMQLLRENDFLPSYEAAGRGRMPVRTTCWNGCVVDYIYSRTREGSDISCTAHDPVFTCASDHLPLISDYQLR